MDGSFHRWLEERGPEGCLIDMADDATNETFAQLGEEETIWAVADTLRTWIEKYGVPLALYVDWKNLYKRPATPREQLRGEEPITQFGRMCAKLGIELIAASSPQAKDYASHCTSSIRCDTTLVTDRRDSLTPCAFRGGLAPGCSYRRSFLPL